MSYIYLRVDMFLKQTNKQNKQTKQTNKTNTMDLQLKVKINRDIYPDQLKIAYGGDAGIDLRANIAESFVIMPNEVKMVPLGIKTTFNEKYVGILYSRSGLGLKRVSLANRAGVIDSKYQNEWKAMIVNEGNEQFIIEPGMRICQVVFHLKASYSNIEYLDEETEFEESERGMRGFGSSGTK